MLRKVYPQPAKSILAGPRVWFLLLAPFSLLAVMSGLSSASAHPQDNAQPRQMSAGQGAESDAKLRALFQQAQEAQSRGDFQAAAASYKDILELQPHLAEARMNLGLMCHLLGEYSQAAGNLEAALRENPDLPAANLFLGLDLLKLHEPSQALGYLQKADRLNPRDEPTARGLGHAYAALREFQPANEWYFRAASMNPQDSEARYGLGITYLDLEKAAASELGAKGQDSLYDKRLLAESFDQQGRVSDAINLYKKLMVSKPRKPGLETALGFDYIRQGQNAAAEAQFRAELSQNPGFLLARLGLARTWLERGDAGQCARSLAEIWGIDRNFFQANAETFWLALAPQKARELADQMRGGAPGAFDEDLRRFLTSPLGESRQAQAATSPSLSLGESAGSKPNGLVDKVSPADLYQQGRYSLCTQKLKESKGLLDRDRLMLLSQCSYYSGDYRDSFLAAGQALARNPSDLEALYWRAASSSKLAVLALLDPGSSASDSYRVHLILGEAYRSRKEFKVSETEYRRALELKPGDPAVELGLATLFWQTKRYDEAITELKAALAGRPGDPEASYLMGDILVGRHQYLEAQPYATAALGAAGRTAYYAHALLGKIYASQDRTNDAIREYQLALPGDDDGSYHLRIYRLYEKAGDREAAAAALRDSEAIRRRQAEGMRTAVARSE